MSKIEISYLKIISIICGILSITLPWMYINITATVGYFSIGVTAYYNLFGVVTEAYLGSIRLDTSEVQVENNLVLFGVLYLMGFLLSLSNVRIDNEDKNESLAKLGALFMIIGIIGYLAVFYGQVYESEMQIASDPSPGNVEISCYPYTGMYAAFICTFLVIAEFYGESIGVFTISHSSGLKQNVPTLQPQTSPNTLVSYNHRKRFCTYCGKPLTQNAKYCESCGKRIS